MSDRTIAMLIEQQRVELAFEITLAALLMAAVTLGLVAAVQMLRHRSRQNVTRAFVVATLLTITCGAIEHQLRVSHLIAREGAIAAEELTFQVDLTDNGEDVAGAAEDNWL